MSVNAAPMPLGIRMLLYLFASADNIKAVWYIGDYIRTITSTAALNSITAPGQTQSDVGDYNRVTLAESKILKGAATTTGGNTADSIYLRFKRHSDLVTCESGIQRYARFYYYGNLGCLNKVVVQTCRKMLK